VGERALQEAKGDALALDVLLADARDHLRDVDEGALGSRRDRVLDVVQLFGRISGALARDVTSLVEHLVDRLLKRLHHRLAGLALELGRLGALDERLHLALGRLDGGDDVVHRLRISDRVTDPDRVRALQNPVVHDALMAAQKGAGALRPMLEPDRVHDRTAARAKHLLV
jgi:hypothetical protein